MEPSSSVDPLRLPDSSLQRHSVSSLFSNLRLSKSPSSLTDAISLSLNSASLAVADQTARELCRLVSASVVAPETALLELTSALDGCGGSTGNERGSVGLVFVKAIGFVVRFWFRSDLDWGRLGFEPAELHPFIKVLLCGEFVETELIRQVCLFTVHNKESGIEAVARFVKPLIIFSILRKDSSNFVMDLISSLASISCSLKEEAISILKLLTGCLKYFPHENQKELKLILSSAEYILDAYIVILKQQSDFSETLESKIQECSWALLETIFSLCFLHNKSFGINETIFQLAKQLFSVQKEINLKFLPEFNSIFVTISYILTQTKFEHEQLAALKLLNFLTDWKLQTGLNKSGSLREELFCVFPIVSLLMSPSKSVKAMASNFLLRINEFIVDLLHFSPSNENLGFNYWKPQFGTHASILFRLLHHLFEGKLDSSSCFYMELIVANDKTETKQNSREEKSWPVLLRKYINISPIQEIIQPGISGLINSVLSVLIIHPKLGKSSIETLAGFGSLDQNSSLPLLLIILFYIKILSSNESNKPELLLKLMESVSSFSAHNFMVPIVVQTVLPMLKSESKPELYSITVRLLCKMWITTDRIFPNLQEVLDPKAISEYISEREISISIAVSIRDICKHNPDRGVDLILSVSSCIESKDKIVQSLGLEGLTYLCEADIVDFYTAWIVIEKHLLDYSLDPIISHGVARLLRWGAMDSEAYPDASKSVLQILWNIASKKNIPSESSSHWTQARVEAFNSLSQYKVVVVQEAIGEFKKGNFELLISEENSEVLNAMEELQMEIIKFEHTTRKRGQKDARIIVSKTEKLLDAFPQVIFSQDKTKYQDLPGASLLCFNFTPKLESSLKSLKDLQKVNHAYEKALMDLAESLHITRNLIFAIISIQSWKSFLDRWIKALINLMKDSSSSDSLDKHTRASKDILKILCRIAEESIPRVAVNIALAICALCLVLPDSAHFVVSDASEFLLKWLSEFKHEHKQWTAGICLGFISDCFHPTDIKTKFKVINSLLQVICKSESCDFVRGACGAGLGFASKTLFKSNQEINLINTSNSEETKLLQKVLTTLSALISKQCPSTSNSLKTLMNQIHSSNNKILLEASEISDEDPWSIAGLILGLGNSVFALYRSGSHDSVILIKNLLIKWIGDKVFDKISDIKLLTGSCFVLPIVISFSQKVDLSTNDDFDSLLENYNSLICEIINVNKSGAIYSDLLMAACIGAGQLISCVLNDGVYDLKLDGVRNLLETIKIVYDSKSTNNYSYSVYIGGLFGSVNAFGASAGYITLQKENTSFIKGPLLSNPSFELIIQEIFLLTKESKDSQRRQFCTWALAFLRNQILKENSDRNSSLSQNLSEETLVWDFSSWLRDFESNKGEINAKKGIISTIWSCLSNAQKLPSFDWGIIIRRFMKYQDIDINKECLNFSLIHANHISPLLNLLDDITDFPRFKTLDLNLQLFLLENISKLLRLFSESRLEKLCADFMQLFTLERNENSILRRSLWIGICEYLRENNDEIISHLEKLMEFMLIKLPNLNGDYLRDEFTENEWIDMIQCLDLASKTWLLNYLKIEKLDKAKKIVIISRLVRHKPLHISELGKIRAYILDSKDEDIWWRVLLEVSATVSNSQTNIKQQWLLDALDISSVSNHPSTALKFVGLLSGFCSELMPVLIVNQITVLSDLPITLSSLLSDPNYSSIRATIAEKVWSTMNRVHSLAEHLMPGPGVGEKEVESVFGMAGVVHQTCVLLKEYLPFDKQIKLANLEVL